ncbi:MAG TPA: hypothetical protein VFX02_04110 [Gammaproteobacteria bacterium]|nr:hypothetical protein [Gammaproteobacteria bacterium]
MIDKLLASPSALIAFVLIVSAAIGFVVFRRPSVRMNRGLWATFALGIMLMVYAALRPEPPAPPKELLTGDISVPAYNSIGTPFQNYMKFPVTMEFAAEGRWSTTDQPDSITDANGGGETADERYILPGAPVGGLVMQRLAGGALEFVGVKSTIELGPQEQVMFLINDFRTDKAYADNTGMLKLNWTCFNCIP